PFIGVTQIERVNSAAAAAAAAPVMAPVAPVVATVRAGSPAAAAAAVARDDIAAMPRVDGTGAWAGTRTGPRARPLLSAFLGRGLEGTPPNAADRFGRGNGALAGVPLQVGTQVGVAEGALVPERLHSAGPVTEDDALAGGHLEGLSQLLARLGRRVG